MIDNVIDIAASELAKSRFGSAFKWPDDFSAESRQYLKSQVEIVVSVIDCNDARLRAALRSIIATDSLDDAIEIAQQVLEPKATPTGKTMSIDEIMVRLAEMRYATITVGNSLNPPTRYCTRVMVGDRGNGSFIINPKDDIKSQQRVIRNRLMEAFRGIDNIEIGRGVSMVRTGMIENFYSIEIDYGIEDVPWIGAPEKVLNGAHRNRSRAVKYQQMFEYVAGRASRVVVVQSVRPVETK